MPASVRHSIDAKEASVAYDLDLSVINSQRFGNLALDILAFNRKTHETGWNFKALILLNHDKVLYKLWSGQPKMDRVEQKKKPLGSLQELDGTARSRLHSKGGVTQAEAGMDSGSSQVVLPNSPQL